jgi:hypothetical protein
MFDPEYVYSKHAAHVNVRLASSETTKMAFMLCLGIVSSEGENYVVGV